MTLLEISVRSRNRWFLMDWVKALRESKVSSMTLEFLAGAVG